MSTTINLSSFQLIKILREKIGEEQAESLAAFVETKVKEEVDSKVKEEVDSKKESLATKEDLANTKAEIIKWMFIFWIGQIATVFAFIKFVK